MSIKQNGGVFGRNPTFNDVTIDGTLTFDGDIDINSDLKVNGELEAQKLIIAKNDRPNGAVIDITNTFEGSGWVGGDLIGSVDFKIADTSTPQKIRAALRAEVDSSVSSSTYPYRVGVGVYTSSNAVLTKTAEFDYLGNLRMNSGKGIDFSATSGTGTSEILSDYEQGTWTPTITGSTSGSVAGITINRAAYTKIGNQVTVYFYISAVNLDTASLVGNAEIGGLPFVAENSFMQLSAVNYTNFFSFDERDISVGGYVHTATKVKLLKGSSTSGIPVGELSGTTQIMMFGMTYESS